MKSNNRVTLDFRRLSLSFVLPAKYLDLLRDLLEVDRVRPPRRQRRNNPGVVRARVRFYEEIDDGLIAVPNRLWRLVKERLECCGYSVDRNHIREVWGAPYGHASVNDLDPKTYSPETIRLAEAIVARSGHLLVENFKERDELLLKLCEMYFQWNCVLVVSKDLESASRIQAMLERHSLPFGLFVDHRYCPQRDRKDPLSQALYVTTTATILRRPTMMRPWGVILLADEMDSASMRLCHGFAICCVYQSIYALRMRPQFPTEFETLCWRAAIGPIVWDQRLKSRLAVRELQDNALSGNADLGSFAQKSNEIWCNQTRNRLVVKTALGLRRNARSERKELFHSRPLDVLIVVENDLHRKQLVDCRSSKVSFEGGRSATAPSLGGNGVQVTTASELLDSKDDFSQFRYVLFADGGNLTGLERFAVRFHAEAFVHDMVPQPRPQNWRGASHPKIGRIGNQEQTESIFWLDEIGCRPSQPIDRFTRIAKK